MKEYTPVFSRLEVKCDSAVFISSLSLRMLKILIMRLLEAEIDYLGGRGDRRGLKCDLTIPCTIYITRFHLTKKTSVTEGFSLSTPPTGTELTYHILKNRENRFLFSKIWRPLGIKIKINGSTHEVVRVFQPTARYSCHASQNSF